MSTMKAGWYVIYTKPRHEKKVTEYLKHLELECFLPLTRTLKVWQGRKKYMHLPLFPSYVFVKLDKLQDYFESMHVPGVLSYVRSCNQIAEISEAVILKLHSIVTNNGNQIEVSFEQFKRGSILTIQAGPFKGFSCEVIQHMGKFKILVRIELLKRNVIVDLPSNYLIQHEPKVYVDAKQYS